MLLASESEGIPGPRPSNLFSDTAARCQAPISGSKPCQAEGMLKQALILAGVLEEMAEKIRNPLVSKGVMLRQSVVFW